MTVKEELLSVEETTRKTWIQDSLKEGVKGSLISSQEQEKPWVETPLKESYALSKAAGW